MATVALSRIARRDAARDGCGAWNCSLILGRCIDRDGWIFS